MGHIGHPEPETGLSGSLAALNIDLDFARKSIRKIRFEKLSLDSYFEIHYDVYVIPHDTKYGDLFRIKYGGKSERYT